MNRVAVVSAILEQPETCQQPFNNVVSSFQGIVKGRLGIPMPEHGMAVVTLVLIGELDDINTLTGKLGNLEHVTAKTSISKTELPSA